MKDEANFTDLVDQLDAEGWEKGFAALLAIHKYLERQYAFLMATGDRKDAKTAANLMNTIAKQDVTLIRLQVYAKQKRGLELSVEH